jgi:SAM-dependent methyltransferase
VPGAGAKVPLSRYYNWLSWFQRITSGIGQGGGYRSSTVHRLLASSDSSVASADVVHERILSVVGPLRAPRVIDAGCGLGGTTFYLHDRLGGEYHGLTLSPTQRAHAEREAVRRGIAPACRFHLRSYDDDPGSVVAGGADLVVAIESLAHSPDPARSITNLAGALRPGGRLVVVDDMPDDGLAMSDHDFAAFREGWQCPAIARRGVVLGALAEAGLVVAADDDLTPLVRRRDPRELERLTKSNRRWRAWVGWTGAGELIDSLYGGLMLERLYRRGFMQYRLVAAQRTAASG